MSISVIAHRLNAINIINDYQYQSIQVQISKAGYRKHEPLDNGEIPHEKMFLFTEITNALSDKYNFNDIVYIKSVYNGLHLPKSTPYSLVPNFGLKTLHWYLVSHYWTSGVNVDMKDIDKTLLLTIKKNLDL